jgi:hypothetical protein
MAQAEGREVKAFVCQFFAFFWFFLAVGHYFSGNETGGLLGFCIALLCGILAELSDE